jgi:conjugal transfer mating pair stabilization protein TraN
VPQPQLGLSFGSAKEPKCGGIPIDKLSQIDLDKVNLDEWFAILHQNGRLPSANNINIEALTGAGSVMNVDGTRRNVQERTLKRLEGVDIDSIRKKATEEVIPQKATE